MKKATKVEYFTSHNSEKHRREISGAFSFAKKRGLSVSFLRTLTDSELFEVADYNLSMELMDNIIHDKKVLDNEED